MGSLELHAILATGGGTPTSASALPMFLMTAGIAMLAVVMLISVRRRTSRRGAARPTSREKLDEIRAKAMERQSAEAASAEMVDLARRLASQLDLKAARLEILLEQADARLAALAGALDASPAPPGAVRAGAPPARIPDDPLSRSVYRLADDGAPPLQIARELGEPVGKVELILALRAAAARA